MKIIPFSHGLTLGVSGGSRSEGLHASDIYNSLHQELDPKRYSKGSAFDQTRLDLGLTVEEILEKGWRERHAGDKRPSEFVTDEGIAFSPDMLVYQPNRTILREYKCTWMSCRECPVSESMAEETKAFLGEKEHRLEVNWDGISPATFPDKLDKWFTQMKFYIRNLGLEWGQLVGLFINADYRPPRPVVLAWELQFSQRELEDTHQMVINHAKHMGVL